ncbi:hypothetical protein EVAR_33131_1 [Eumeta japonica]|uniref:Uncharacterized protein n=1 Tax=Eumeta variegata TaxID=151549 RepID=A0A4C1Y743_EUMVA|nr:hypothetical protein EVAR_33131_1 [Eumeta japonica]
MLSEETTPRYDGGRVVRSVTFIPKGMGRFVDEFLTQVRLTTRLVPRRAIQAIGPRSRHFINGREEWEAVDDRGQQCGDKVRNRWLNILSGRRNV